MLNLHSKFRFYSKKQQRHKQCGVAGVEFALIAPVLFTLMFGIIEMGRVFFYLNSAAEATGIGARTAAVCTMNAPIIKARMRTILPIITNNNQIAINYSPPGCSAGTCTSVTISFVPNSVPITTYIPYVPLAINLPSFPTTLRRESMNSTSNPVC